MSDEIKIKLSPGTIFVDKDALEVKPDKKKTSKRKKKEENDEDVEHVEVVEIIPSDKDKPKSELTDPNMLYKNTYEETNMMLKGIIYQTDQASIELQEDLNDIRKSKTLKNKYSYISDLTQAKATLINVKMGAIREINNSIKNSHELELKRMKELKLSEASQDDVKTLQNIYTAFVSTPVQQNMTGFMSPLGPTTSDFTLYNPGAYNVATMNQNPEIGYNNYLNNMTPEQMMMLIEDDPNIDQVLAYNPTTGVAEFKFYDSANQKYIEGVPTRSMEMFGNSLQYDFDNMQVRNNDLNESYRILMDENLGNNIPPTLPNNNDMSNY